MKNKKSSETSDMILQKESEKIINTSSNIQKCKSCKHDLPEKLDRNICPTCHRRTG